MFLQEQPPLTLFYILHTPGPGFIFLTPSPFAMYSQSLQRPLADFFYILQPQVDVSPPPSFRSVLKAPQTSASSNVESDPCGYVNKFWTITRSGSL